MSTEVQLKREGWGGARRGAGRPKSRFRSDPAHRARPELAPEHPVHITLRAVKGLPELREPRVYEATRDVLARYLDQPDFRIVHISIQRNHFHLIVEASDRAALSLRMGGFVIALAKAINGAFRRCGPVFEHRYHERQIRTPGQARSALAFVINNWRRHQQDFTNGRMSKLQLDPYASGCMLVHWTALAPTEPVHPPWPVSPPHTELLKSAWLRHGRLDPWECPGPLAISWR